MGRFRRFVAIGDSATEGLEDADGHGGYRGWADRLALLIASRQDEPLEYANLAIRGLRLHEIRESQLAPALALRPDLISIAGGVNDVISPRPRFGELAADFEAMFGAAVDSGATVVTFTMPDPSTISPIGALFAERMAVLNDLIRAAAQATGALLMDFAPYPIAVDPRLWAPDRLHGNTLGHQRIAAALGWRLGIEGCDESWAAPLPEQLPSEPLRHRLAGDVDWAVHYLAPWLGKGIRRVPHGLGISPKRPVPRVVEV
ncbi:lysophospholipase L1-like esterase [Friedmanniella endophytica]|uniref:Lysophospholipase L1-like esterase n=1 Tax=Microlunatus kandeliicorticis TaxID=1759536 RepID=A0A7W3IRD0_9ACTN|nr:SGNH/GDSL hydrolase family protein [Microlunatus kandeliicorticis]MBA8793824.1 lysophospholipase L1-like esterase [Microlunatus kandeliicorticis]